jgi:DNA-binding GntR family transcriptional regulator
MVNSTESSKATALRRHLEPTSVVDVVLNRLRLEIISGALAPGEPLMISALSEELGVSHIPVREALRQLESEGFIQRHHGRGVSVTAVTAERLRDIFRIRLAIEPDLAARAVTMFTDEGIEELGGHLHRLKFDESPNQLESVLGVHYDFHRALVLPAASEWDLRILTILWNASDRSIGVVFTNWATRWGSDVLNEIHLPMYEAAVARDPKMMREALTQHLVEGVDMLAEALGRKEK